MEICCRITTEIKVIYSEDVPCAIIYIYLATFKTKYVHLAMCIPINQRRKALVCVVGNF